MSACHLKGAAQHPYGIQSITRLDGDMRMDFDILRMKKGDVYQDDAPLECAYLLVYGKVRFAYQGKEHVAARQSCFDDAPTALHVPRAVGVAITALSDDAEINILRTDNERDFTQRLYLPCDAKDEYRGAGLMREASTRIVRTIFDHSNAPYANLVLGEVIGFPGKWSSYPPHHHPQPEIYYYKTNPPQGFAYAELGDNVVKVHNNDAVLIHAGLTHPQCTPPGYALWYLWGIRHLEGNPYITPTFIKEHLWVLEKDVPYWGDKKQ